MWELGYITHRSAKRRGYLVGPFGSVYEHRIPYTQSIVHTLRITVESDCPPEERVSCVNSQETLPMGKSHGFSCPCAWVDGNSVIQ